MKRFLAPYSPTAYAGMRIVLAFLYWSHGMQKLFGVFGGRSMRPMSLLWVAGTIEIVLGVLIAVGLLTSCAAFLASGEMAVAYFIAHAPRGGLPVQNQGEMAVALCFAFLFIATRGGGPWSLDSRVEPPH